jgi:hypothetical protein
MPATMGRGAPQTHPISDGTGLASIGRETVEICRQTAI